ncbi:MAG: family 43 glycosylhydrolase [Clostridia bacterium]|nr:family 43 glycosylhydrolase [Clostridia bacterium]
MKNKDIHIRDPFILVHDGKYYMYGTRGKNFGQQTGGVDVYIGTDLENWSDPIEVFNSEKFGLNRQANWAPEVHEFGGKYYMFATFLKENDLRGTYILISDSPDGEFTPLTGKAITPWEWECLDGTFYVENGVPYCIFCHEHTQIYDGTVEYIQLSADLKEAVTEPKTLFKGSSFLKKEATESDHNVTDGPFLFRKANGKLIMIWSTCHNGYLQCVAASSNGRIDGNWTHLPPMFEKDGGHGMIFTGLDGQLYLTLHCPNGQPNERPKFFEIEETEDSLQIK